MATFAQSLKLNLWGLAALFSMAQSDALAQKPTAATDASKAKQDSALIARLQPGFAMLKNPDAAYMYGQKVADMKRMPENVQRYRDAYIIDTDTVDVQILKEGTRIKTQTVNLSNKNHRLIQSDDGPHYKVTDVQMSDSTTVETEMEKLGDINRRTFRVIKGNNRLFGVCKAEDGKKEECSVSMAILNPDPDIRSTYFTLIDNASGAKNPAVVETNYCVDGTHTPLQIINTKPDAVVNFRNNGVRLFGAENYEKTLNFICSPQ